MAERTRSWVQTAQICFQMGSVLPIVQGEHFGLTALLYQKNSVDVVSEWHFPLGEDLTAY